MTSWLLYAPATPENPAIRILLLLNNDPVPETSTLLRELLLASPMNNEPEPSISAPLLRMRLPWPLVPPRVIVPQVTTPPCTVNVPTPRVPIWSSGDPPVIASVPLVWTTAAVLPAVSPIV